METTWIVRTRRMLRRPRRRKRAMRWQIQRAAVALSLIALSALATEAPVLGDFVRVDRNCVIYATASRSSTPIWTASPPAQLQLLDQEQAAGYYHVVDSAGRSG